MSEKKIQNAKVKVTLPKGCKKTNLSINALDSYTRELALKTQLKVGTKPLLCNSMKVTDKGTLLIEVRPECFELATA